MKRKREKRKKQKKVGFYEPTSREPALYVLLPSHRLNASTFALSPCNARLIVADESKSYPLETHRRRETRRISPEKPNLSAVRGERGPRNVRTPPERHFFRLEDTLTFPRAVTPHARLTTQARVPKVPVCILEPRGAARILIAIHSPVRPPPPPLPGPSVYAEEHRLEFPATLARPAAFRQEAPATVATDPGAFSYTFGPFDTR